MSKPHPLAGLIANYGDSDEDSDDGLALPSHAVADKEINRTLPVVGQDATHASVPGIHSPPVPHCPWSACYDESSGFTYYWNQKTNAVTWEAPPEYLLALKIAQQHLHTSGAAEVSAEEWQLYQQALAEKQNSQNKLLARVAIAKASVIVDKPANIKEKRTKGGKKRPTSDDEDEKIELITSYHNSDSESNDEEPPLSVPPPAPKAPKTKNNKRLKTKEYGPTLPNLDYSAPIGPELPPTVQTNLPKTQKSKALITEKENKKPVVPSENKDNQDEGALMKRLKDKVELLERLGGELPSELQQIIGSDSKSNSPTEDIKTKLDIDDLLQEIEQKKFKPKESKDDVTDNRSNISSVANSPKSDGNRTPPLEQLKTLIGDNPPVLFPSGLNDEPVTQVTKSEKKENIYLMDSSEPVENVSRKRLRISNSVLPERKVEALYTTRYAHTSDNFERHTGLGFREDVAEDSPKETVNYGNGLTFTKGGTLNSEPAEPVQPAQPIQPVHPVKPAEPVEPAKPEPECEVLETRLSQLCEMQPFVVPQLQRMLIQLQTLLAAQKEGALCTRYLNTWSKQASELLPALEAIATSPPPGWTCSFQRSVGRYRYLRESDGLQQWERPAMDNTDMDISTTPPHPGIEPKDEASSPIAASAPQSPGTSTPPPPKWPEPPPPGCDEPPPLPPEPAVKEIGDELMSFYNDIAELEKVTPVTTEPAEPTREKDTKPIKKKPKVKISTSMGLKHKSVSNLVAKWQQVAEEINSD